VPTPDLPPGFDFTDPFDAIADHLPNLAPHAKAERLRSGWLNGVKHWRVDYTGE